MAAASESGDKVALAEAESVALQAWRYRRRVRVAQFLLVTLILCVWQIGSGTLLDPFYLGSPLGIIRILGINLRDPGFYADLSITGFEMLAGYLVGSVLGIGTGMAMAKWQFAADVTNPFFVAINSIPRVALAPLLIVWFGIDYASKIVLSATLVYFLMFFSTLSGIRGVDRALVDVARVIGANERQIFMRVYLPGAAAWIMNGLRMSLPFALIGVIVGEFLAASSGLGYRLNGYSTNYNTDGTFAMLIVMMTFMLLINNSIAWVEKRALRARAVAESAQVST